MPCHHPTWISEPARALKRRVLFNTPLHPGACSLKGGRQANDVAGHASLKDLFIVQDEQLGLLIIPTSCSHAQDRSLNVQQGAL